MKDKKTRRMLILLISIIVVIISFAIFSLIKFNNMDNSKPINDRAINKTGWRYNKLYDYNQINFLNVKEYNGLAFNNLRLRLFNDNTYILFLDVSNYSEQDVYHKSAKIVFLDEKGNELASSLVPLEDIKVGETATDIYVRYDKGESLLNVVDYKIEEGTLVYYQGTEKEET